MSQKPKLHVGNIAGPDGNAFVILGRAQKVAKDNGLDWDAISKDAKSADYSHLLQVMEKHFEVQYDTTD